MEKPESFHGIISRCKQMKKLFRLIERVSKTDASILLRGETGTGKELFANAIHNLSNRSSAPLKELNCATLSSELMQSELFGHKKGSFTGAINDRIGLFAQAHTGTIFLDEIAEIPADIQPRLLRTLQEKTITPLGSTKTQTVDVRFISATHQSLRKAVKESRFREDLMYRIRVVPIFIPALRHRIGDIELLSQHFVDEFNSSKVYRQIKGISEEAKQALLEYDFPGNVRELRNNIEHAFAVGTSDFIETRDFTPELRGENYIDEGSFKEDERDLMKKALIKSSGNKGKAAEYLGWSRAKFWRKSRELNLS